MTTTDKTTHTPGPWTHYLQGDSTAHIVATERKDQYGRREQDIVRVATGEANARLIASAPDLLAACEAAEKIIGNLPSDGLHPRIRTVWEQITAAIAKARGGK